MRPAHSLLAALLTGSLLVACGTDGGGGGPDADPFAPDADVHPDADPLAPDAMPPGPDAAPPFPSCLETCSSPADCAASGSPINDADNYACEGGRCRWLGCNSTGECMAAIGANYVCGTISGDLIPSCYQGCSSGSDCAIAGSVLYDADNWRCEVGKCRWVGCNSTSECTTTLMSPNYMCAPNGAGFNSCWATCAAPADCANPASPLLDADNFECPDGLCHWLGCNSTSECTDAFMNPAYVCEPI